VRATFFTCTPATLIDRSRWETHEHAFDATDDEDKLRALKETCECHIAQCDRLGLTPEVDAEGETIR
jgi:hypothetical protein